MAAAEAALPAAGRWSHRPGPGNLSAFSRTPPHPKHAPSDDVHAVPTSLRRAPSSRGPRQAAGGDVSIVLRRIQGNDRDTRPSCSRR
ncbi:hypothetical protein ACP70R_005028 [Stipagrostis hirtigluma subsp. patula]